MRSQNLTVCVAGLLLAMLNVQLSAEELNVFLFAGQSNMAGADSERPVTFPLLAADQSALFTAAPLPAGGTSPLYQAWGPIAGHQLKGVTVHGPETGFARTLHEAGWRNVAIIKVFANFRADAAAWPWSPGESLHTAWQTFVSHRLQELREQGYDPIVRGFVWHQGIDDAIHPTLADDYSQSLTALIHDLRERYAAPDAPFILARSVFSRIAQPGPDPQRTSRMARVRAAQLHVASSVARTAWINVDDLPNVNSHHFTAAGQLVLGRRFAEAFLNFVSRPIPVAHRGMLRHAPENTLPAFAACLDLGMGFELDIRTTSDGELVIIHDDSLERTTNGGARSIREITLEELRTLDAGSWFDESYAGITVPTLRETLQLIRERKRGRTLIALNVKDITPDGEVQLVRLVEEYQLLSESFAFDQSDECSTRLQELNPSFRVGRNVGRSDIDQRLQQDALNVFLLTSTPQQGEVAWLHSHGRQVLYNYAGPRSRSESAWQQAFLAGIAGLLTDYPIESQQLWRRLSAMAHLPVLDTSAVWVEEPFGTPVIDRGAAGEWDHLAVDNPFVFSDQTGHYCFFEAQDAAFDEGGREAFGIAVSQDGIHWEKQAGNPILNTGPAGAWDSVVAKLPAAVTHHNGLYYLFYSGRDQNTKQIGLATAQQITGPWTKNARNPILSARSAHWDKVLSTHPAPLFRHNNSWYMLYRGMRERYRDQGLGVAVSDDLRTWTRVDETPVIPVHNEIASIAVTATQTGYLGISQPLDLSQRSYWLSHDLQRWTQGPPVQFKASAQAETLSNPFFCNGEWTVLYEQQDRIYRAVLRPAPAE